MKRARELGITFGNYPTGKMNSICDVDGVKVGHITLHQGGVQTGVTAIIPHGGNTYNEKLVCASHVINGFGKSIGLMQIDELGSLETPILLTNTFSVGTVQNSLITYMLETNADIGNTTGTVNPVVLECNDGAYLNDIRDRRVNESHGLSAIRNAKPFTAEGAIGAGRGMSCYQLKGGIGSASRLVRMGNNDYTIGVLVMSNHGKKDELTIAGHPIGKAICKMDETVDLACEKGSIIIVVATDIPMTHRQLKRLIKRSTVGLSRTGSNIGHGSGDVVVGFSTASKIPHDKTEELLQIKAIHSSYMDIGFRAVADAVEEAIINSMLMADTVIGKGGNRRVSLSTYLPLLKEIGEWPFDLI